MQIRPRTFAAICMLLLLPWVGCSSRPTQRNSVGQVSNQTPELSHRKSNKMERILDITKNLGRIAGANTNAEKLSDDIRQEVYQQVAGIQQPDQLVTLALICKAILGSQSAGDERYDSVFEVAFWHCVRLLTENTSEEGVMALQILKEEANPDAGATQMFEEALSKQQSKIQQEKKQPR